MKLSEEMREQMAAPTFKQVGEWAKKVEYLEQRFESMCSWELKRVKEIEDLQRECSGWERKYLAYQVATECIINQLKTQLESLSSSSIKTEEDQL